MIVVYGKDPDLNANKLLVTEICFRPPPFQMSPPTGIWNADQSSAQLNKFINGGNSNEFPFVNLISDNLLRVKNDCNPNDGVVWGSANAKTINYLPINLLRPTFNFTIITLEVQYIEIYVNILTRHVSVIMCFLNVSILMECVGLTSKPLV